MNKAQTLLTTAVLLFGISGSGITDFNDGVNAYQKGDYKTAFNEWKPLAEQGDARAQYNLGLMHANGEGMLRDEKEAVKWYRKAAEQGDAEAQYNLGLMYDKLWDLKEAVKWLLKAAEQGDVDAQLHLGWRYANGDNFRRNASKAKYWTKKAYENPNADTEIVELAEENWNTFKLWKY